MIKKPKCQELLNHKYPVGWFRIVIESVWVGVTWWIATNCNWVVKICVWYSIKSLYGFICENWVRIEFKVLRIISQFQWAIQTLINPIQSQFNSNAEPNIWIAYFRLQTTHQMIVIFTKTIRIWTMSIVDWMILDSTHRSKSVHHIINTYVLYKITTLKVLILQNIK